MKFTTNFAFLAVAVLCATTLAIPLPGHPEGGQHPEDGQQGQPRTKLRILRVSLIQYDDDDCFLNFG